MRFLMDSAAPLIPSRRWSEVAIVLTDDTGIAAFNRQFLNRSHATDVITFTLPPAPGLPGMHAGQIVVNLECALREGGRRGDTRHELALYLAHGCDHLADQDDATPALRRRMRRREESWLAAAARRGLMGPLWQGDGGHPQRNARPTGRADGRDGERAG